MNPINRVTELKIKKTKLATIITAISGGLKTPTEAQLLAVNEWGNAAGRVIIHSAYKMPVTPNNGIRVAPTRQENPSVADIMRAYVVQIPGDEIFAIAAPNLLFNGDQLKLFAHVEKEKMERAWACFVTTPGNNAPVAFVMSAPVLPHILRDMPNTLTFANESWAVWLDQWLSKFMLRHRYFDATSFDLVSPLVAPIEVLQSVDLSSYKIEDSVIAPDAITSEPAPTPEPVRKKGGRPRKVVVPSTNG